MFKGANRYQKVVGQNGAGKGISGLFLPWTGAFCFEFSGRGRKSGSAYALVDLVTLAPLLINNTISVEKAHIIIQIFNDIVV